MPGRSSRLIFRSIGWVATPLVLIASAAIGAGVGLVIAPLLSPYVAVGAVLGLSLLAAVAGLLLWIRMLRTSPRLRHTLEMTVQGVPDSPLVEHIIHPDQHDSGAS